MQPRRSVTSHVHKRHPSISLRSLVVVSHQRHFFHPRISRSGSDEYDKNVMDMDETKQRHLGWTAKQGYILTGGGRAEEYYTKERGFPFSEEELPHYHLLKGDTRDKFREFKDSKPPCKLVCGAWNRPLFVGGWKHSSDQEERTYNIQTHNLFIDLRVPKTREVVLKDAMDRVRDAIRVPWKHINSILEPTGKDYESALPSGDFLHGNTAQNFSAYLTRSALEMNSWHDMDAAPHHQFGTVDNPALIFTSDSSWR